MQFFKKWANPVLFFIYFRLFRTHYKFYNKYVCEKMSIHFTVPRFELTTFGTRVSSHDH